MTTPQPRIHPAVLDWQSDLRNGTLSRREFLRLATLLGVSAVTAAHLAACGLTAQQPAPTPTVPPSQIKRGGTLRIGTSVQPVDHPARLTWAEAANQLRQVAEYLTETGPDNITTPWLLERWEVDEAVKTWTLFLRQGIKFNTGQPFTVDDVIFNFQQWLDPDLGSSMGSLLSYLSPNNIERIDDYTIRLHLDKPQIGVPEHLFHFPALIVPRDFEGDFIKQPVGTGPFELIEFSEAGRVVLRRREGYWRVGADGRSLPYLDELIYLDLDTAERIAAMQGQQVDTIYSPGPADWAKLQTVPGLEIHSVSTSWALVLRMRVDQEPWRDGRVRQALKLCQDRKQILESSYFMQGDLGLDAHVAPVHPAFCERPVPAYDPARARALLAEAGYPDGLTVTLTTKNDQGEPEMAQLLKQLAAPGGFDIKLNIVEPSIYWGQWTEVGLGITSWAHRSLDTMALALGYVADETGRPAAWNETRWVDEEFAALLEQAERTLDVERRREFMCQIEAIMQERGPIGISYWRQVWNITRTEFKNIKAHPSNFDLFYDVWRDETI